jgi:hypothetical protein
MDQARNLHLHRIPPSQAKDRLAEIQYDLAAQDLSVLTELARKERALLSLVSKLDGFVMHQSAFGRKAERVTRTARNILDRREGSLHQALQLWPTLSTEAKNSLDPVLEILTELVAQGGEILWTLEQIEQHERRIEKLQTYRNSLPKLFAQIMTDPDLSGQLNRAYSKNAVERVGGEIAFAEQILISENTRLNAIRDTLSVESTPDAHEVIDVEGHVTHALAGVRKEFRDRAQAALDRISDGSAIQFRWQKGHRTPFKRRPKKLQSMDDAIRRADSLRNEGKRQASRSHKNK